MIGNYSRFGSSKQISLGIIILIFIKILESYANKLMLNSQGYWLHLYLPILTGFSIFGILMVLASNQRLLGNKKTENETI